MGRLMLLFVDLDLGRFVSGAGLGTAPRTIEQKRGDAGEVRIQFVQGDTLVQLAADSIIFYEAKLRGQYNTDPLIQASDFTEPAVADGQYAAALTYDVTALDEAFESSDSLEESTLSAMFEVSWQEPGKGWLSTDTQVGIIHNDVVRSGGALLPQIAAEVPGVASSGSITVDSSVAINTMSGVFEIFKGGDWFFNLYQAPALDDFAGAPADPVLIDNFNEVEWYFWLLAIADLINSGAVNTGVAGMSGFVVQGTISANPDYTATVTGAFNTNCVLTITARETGPQGDGASFTLSTADLSVIQTGLTAGGVDSRDLVGTDVVKTLPQTLTAPQQAQALANIGAVSDVPGEVMTLLVTGSGLTLDESNRVVACTATLTVTLPDPAGIDQGTVYTINNVGTGTVTVSSLGSVNIDNSSSVLMTTQWSTMTVISAGTGWYKI